MHLQNQRLNVVQFWGKSSTSSLAAAPEMLASEVTPGLRQEQSLMPISFMSQLVYKGVIKWMQTQKNIILTHNPKPGYAQAGEVLI
jgi:hypothetical protein